jgi:hypothetical protein
VAGVLIVGDFFSAGAIALILTGILWIKSARPTMVACARNALKITDK